MANGRFYLMDVTAIRPEDVQSVYKGKAGKCGCGCSGRHVESGEADFKARLDEALAQFRLNRESVIVDATCAAVQSGDRDYFVYFTEEFKSTWVEIPARTCQAFERPLP